MSRTTQLCDTIPPPTPLPSPSSRRLCVRHVRMADEDTSSKLQQSLDALSLPERETINSIWSSFSSSHHPTRALILQGLLTICCFSQLSLLTEQLAHLIRIDPFVILPHEVCLRVLRNLDAISLCRAAQVSRRWRMLADDNILWRGLCEQHIGQKCLKCGWGLPILNKNRASHPDSPSLPRCRQAVMKRRLSNASISDPECANKRQRLEFSSNSLDDPLHAQATPDTLPHTITRHWKDVYCERLTIERNWRSGRCTVRTLTGHTDGVMCLQFSERLSHPSYSILITGSYDCTARVWNLETGVELHCLQGHNHAIKALQFDEVKLITGSMDNTIRVWDWRKGKCIRILTGHTEGIVCLQFDSNVLASGSVDATIKVWNLRSHEAFTLRGHSNWVNSVQLWDSLHSNENNKVPLEMPTFEPPFPDRSLSPTLAPPIDPGKMLFSASDDHTIRLWDLTQRSCVRLFTGHVAQVQSIKLLQSPWPTQSHLVWPPESQRESTPPPNQPTSPYPGLLLVSGSLDNTIKTWDIQSGKALATLFGHIEGVWAIAGDRLRLVSASHDRTIKVWDRQESRCQATLVGHRRAVTCLALGEDKIVSGGDDGDIKIWNFGG